ncbi:MAG TPA: glycosyltransferase family 2 protein [Xanthomonadaceae bacterium]|nr:glycosyltransferase family 2 protein [Xanthomonadaceae bacterium]
MSELNRIAVLVPALNEVLRIREVVTGALAHCPNVIVVDDGSSDGTLQQIAELPVTVIAHDERRGKGESLRDGFRAALARGCEGVLTMDGDGQHSAEDIPRLLAAARAFPGHIVIGARLIERERQPAVRRAANDFADWGIGWACGQRLLDTQSGQRYYPRAAMALVEIATEGFVFESEILIEASRRLGMRVVAVPIRSRYQGEFRRSHFRPVRDFCRIAGRVIYRIARARFAWKDYRRSRRQAPLLFDPETPHAQGAAP